MDLVHLAATVTTAVAPFMEKLFAMTSATASWAVGEGKAHAGTIARELWNVLKPHLSASPKLANSARVVADDSTDVDARATFAKRLAEALEADASLRKQIEAILVKHADSLQEVTADSGALVKRVQLTLEGGGTQRIQATNSSVIEDVILSKK